MKKIAKQAFSDGGQDVTEENQARVVVYNFLSSLFARELNEDFVNQLTSAQGRGFLNSLAVEPALAPSINVISTQLIKLDSKEPMLELAADFCGLFLVDGMTSVSPYAGQYINNDFNHLDTVSKKKSDRTLIFGELHQLMMDFLTKSNIQIHKDFPEPADHIAVMLAYLAHLSVSDNTESQINFIELYLMTWLSDFTQQVKMHDPGCFYAAVAELTLEWVKLDINE